MKVKNELQVYEQDGKEIKGIEYPIVKIESHWNYKDRVVVEIDGKKVTLIADDLRRAIDNATNHKAL
jgi:hypothetical protein